MQAELIRELTRDLMEYAGAAALQHDILRNVSLDKLADALGGQTVQGPSPGEINSAIKKMREDIERAQSAQETLDTVFSFALKIAPIVLA